ncbi:hypothetical protein UlMin_015825 [Ulmus minor]
MLSIVNDDEKQKQTEKKENKEKEITKSSKRSLQSTTLVCGICMEEKTKAKMFRRIKCKNHLFCRDCMGKHVATKIGQNITKVKCPGLGCNVLLETQNCRSIVPKAVVDRWEVAIYKSRLFGWQKIYCPFPDCSVLLVADNEEKAKGLISLECPSCHRMFCARCSVPWHAGSKCLIETNDDRRLANLARKRSWKRCPNCRFYVEKRTGCDRITCRCGHKFCYNCGKLECGHFCGERPRNPPCELEFEERIFGWVQVLVVLILFLVFFYAVFKFFVLHVIPSFSQ